MDWQKLSVEDRDRAAWEAICGWPKAAGAAVVAEGVDYAELSRCLLWDKVGRAVRRQVDPEGFRFEEQAPGSTQPEARGDEPGAATTRDFGLRIKMAFERRRGVRVLFCPFPYARHARLLDPLIERREGYEVVVPQAHARQWPGAVPVRPCIPASSGTRVADDLHRRMVDGLRSRGIDLVQEDHERLLGELRRQLGALAEARAVLSRLRPDAVLLPADNHSPFIEYALAARALEIPSVMMQHGLDCERFFLDEAHASHIAVWGPERAERYRRHSRRQPQALAATGYPPHDAFSLRPRMEGGGGRWLWVTRPHTSRKCYLASRHPREGLQILDALLAAVRAEPGARLRIKPHPFDFAALYGERIRAAGMERQAEVTQDRIDSAIQEAQVVIAEDSTAGLDAMFQGKILVHAHLALSPPVMPFVSYQSALPGFSEAQIAESLRQAGRLSREDLEGLLKGQRRFLADFAGPCDGRATDRFCDWVREALKATAA